MILVNVPFMRCISSHESRRSPTRAAMSLWVSVMSATSLAMAVPLPMATPTLAAERDGESFTPSPTMTTR